MSEAERDTGSSNRNDTCVKWSMGPTIQALYSGDSAQVRGAGITPARAQFHVLRKALVLYALLVRRGIDAQLLIGVAKATNGQLDAHAWLECRGKILLGEPATGRYS